VFTCQRLGHDVQLNSFQCRDSDNVTLDNTTSDFGSRCCCAAVKFSYVRQTRTTITRSPIHLYRTITIFSSESSVRIRHCPRLPIFNMPSPYSVLGISRDASEEEIRRAYRRLVMQYHPDKNRGDEAWAAQRFSEVQDAYQQLQGGHNTGRASGMRYGPSGRDEDFAASNNTRTGYPRSPQQSRRGSPPRTRSPRPYSTSSFGDNARGQRPGSNYSRPNQSPDRHRSSSHANRTFFEPRGDYYETRYEPDSNSDTTIIERQRRPYGLQLSERNRGSHRNAPRQRPVSPPSSPRRYDHVNTEFPHCRCRWIFGVLVYLDREGVGHIDRYCDAMGCSQYVTPCEDAVSGDVHMQCNHCFGPHLGYWLDQRAVHGVGRNGRNGHIGRNRHVPDFIDPARFEAMHINDLGYQRGGGEHYWQEAPERAIRSGPRRGGRQSRYRDDGRDIWQQSGVCTLM
jgi:hypothetical protein